MDIQITFRGMDHSTIIENYAREQMAKIIEFLTNERIPIYIHLVFTANPKKNHHEVEIRIKTPRHDLISNHKGPEMYDILDRVLDTAYLELREKKRELNDDKKTGKGDWYKGA